MKLTRKSMTVCMLSTVSLVLAFSLLGAAASAVGIGSEPIFQLACPPLEGFWSDEPAPPKLRLKRWLSGQFQNKFDNWFSAHCGGRNPLIRMNNQILYALFRRSYMFQGRIAVCDSDALYMTNYLADYFHQCNQQDIQLVSHFVSDLEQLQNSLQKRGTAFVFLITPSKCKSLPPSISAPWDKRKIPDSRIYDELVRQLRERNIQYVDGRQITSELESKKTAQTFTPGGIHWTQPAAAATFNEVLSKINKQRTSQFPLIKTSAVSYGPPDAIERDLASILNLLTPNYNYKVEHAEFCPSDPAWKPSGKIVFEGTSFVEQLTTVAFRANMFSTMRHYFYYTTALNIFPQVKKLDVNASTINWDHDILDADAVIIENNEGLPFDHCQHFVSDALSHIKNSALAQNSAAQIR